MSQMHLDHSAYNSHIQSLRQKEYPSLLETTYLDHAGTTLYSQSLIDACHQDLKSNLYGNPHSDSPASHLSTRKVDNARLSVLKYFNADPDYFDVVFTANATAAIKLVTDCFRDQHFWYGFHKDAHSSIVGVRELAQAGSRCFASDEEVDEWIATRKRSVTSTEMTLFAYPAQSNMTGYRLPYRWSSQVRASDPSSQNTFVLLDAASYLTTGRLNLEDHTAAPDFIALSFYKIFGYPDLGALIVRKSANDILNQRRYFGGGTVNQVTVLGSASHVKKTDTIHDHLEDGTLPFHNIVALTHAINIHNQLFTSAQAISNHTSHLSAWLYQQLSSLRHFNDTSVVILHKDPRSTYGDPTTQGPILAFNVVSSDGNYVGQSHFERLAIDCGFQLRTGGVCNPGGIATMLDLCHWELRRNYVEGARCGGDIDVVGGKPTGIIRISLGPMTTLGDVGRFVKFVEWFFVEDAPSNLLSMYAFCDEETSLSKGVRPLEYCPPIDLRRTGNAHAYEVWNGQWCIVESTSGYWKPLKSRIACGNLVCNIEPEQGILRVSRPGMTDLMIDLWDRPGQHPDGPTITTSGNQRAFDTYIDQNIADWLTTALGLPCTLARYRGKDAQTLPEARTCVVPGCSIRLPTKSDLYRHYAKLHAEPFLRAHPFPTLKDSPLQINTGAQAQRPINIQPKQSSTWRRIKSWLSQSKSLRSSPLNCWSETDAYATSSPTSPRTARSDSLSGSSDDEKPKLKAEVVMRWERQCQEKNRWSGTTRLLRSPKML